MNDRVAGTLEVGVDECGDIVINGGPAALDERGDWHIVFSADQAIGLAVTLPKQVQE